MKKLNKLLSKERKRKTLPYHGIPTKKYRRMIDMKIPLSQVGVVNGC